MCSSVSSAQLIVDGVSFSYGPRPVLHDVSITVGPGDRIGILGPNGSGKSTLLALMAGRLKPESGSITAIPPDTMVGEVTQTLADRPGETVAQFLARVSGLADAEAEFEAATRALAGPVGGPDPTLAPADRYDRALARYLAAGPDTFARRRDQALTTVGLAGVGVARATRSLSGGQRTRLNLATVALSTHGILLLDEPTNDLDRCGLDILSSLVAERDGGIVLVSHDRAFLADTVTSVLELEPGERTATLYHGGYESWQTERRRAREQHQQRWNHYTDQLADLEARARRHRQWSERGVRKVKASGEPDRNIRQARLARAEKGTARAEVVDRARDRLEKVDKPFEPWVLQLRFAPAERGSERVAELHGAVVRVGDFTLGPVDLEVVRGDRLLITGPNGGGKSTLLAAVLGRRRLESGTQRLARSVRVGQMGQSRRPFPGSADLLAGFQVATGLSRADARSGLAKLGLDAGQIDRPPVELSPGEQTRALLGVVAATGTNLLVLDEPTNHLDLEAIEELELALEAFPGTVLLVTHDRRLIQSVSRVWTEEGGGMRRLVVTDGQLSEISGDSGLA